MHTHDTHTAQKNTQKKHKKDPEKVLSAKVSFITSFGDRKRMAVMERKGERNSDLCSRRHDQYFFSFSFFFFFGGGDVKNSITERRALG